MLLVKQRLLNDNDGIVANRILVVVCLRCEKTCRAAATYTHIYERTTKKQQRQTRTTTGSSANKKPIGKSLLKQLNDNAYVAGLQRKTAATTNTDNNAINLINNTTYTTHNTLSDLDPLLRNHHQREVTC